jgi:hypothetical protein
MAASLAASQSDILVLRAASRAGTDLSDSFARSRGGGDSIDSSSRWRDTFDSSSGAVTTTRSSLQASKLLPHWSPDTLPACEICSASFSLR